MQKAKEKTFDSKELKYLTNLRLQITDYEEIIHPDLLIRYKNFEPQIEIVMI